MNRKGSRLGVMVSRAPVYCLFWVMEYHSIMVTAARPNPAALHLVYMTL